jgi:chemotaxis protein methyltransferase WspC
MPLDAIERLLKERMGLHSSTVGSSTIQHAVEQRMRDCAITEIADYGQVLSHSDTELDALIDTVIIPETWFFRDINPFHALTQWLQDSWLPHHVDSTLRILSVPCSSGEEAYTLAMCLADAGISPRNAQIDAIDISRTNIDKANKGEYGRNSFRGNQLEYRDRHFQFCNGRYRINDNNREYVCFEQANLLDNSFTHNRASYHVIFCRNLLIYFDRQTQDAAIDCLQTLLTRDGLLFLGHSETSLLLNRDFTALHNQRCFGFYHNRARAPHTEPGQTDRGHQQVHRRQAASTETQVPLPFTDISPGPDDTPTTEQGKHSELHNDLLQRAFRLADEGHLGEAAEYCENLLAGQAHQADAYYLLGLIRESTGSLPEAEQLLRKAVYLDPVHHEALVHLGIVCEQRGDTGNARRFRERAKRTAPGQATRVVK